LSPPPRLLVLGHVTRDVFGAETAAGGAATFAGLAGALFGLETAVVTVAPPDAPELAVLRGVKNLSLHIAPDNVMTTFGHEHVGGRRKLSLLACARPLVWQDVPVGWQSPDVVYAGPVAGECDAALLGHFESAYGVACIQGWLREVRSGAPVRPRRLPEACELPRILRAVSFSAADHPDGAWLARELCARGVHVAVTRGRRGARVSSGQQQWHVPAAPAREENATGAGDVFALVFGLSLWAGSGAEEAAGHAARAAARVVEGPGLGSLPGADFGLEF
jgi:1D-myo-inositol 3-kinase